MYAVFISLKWDLPKVNSYRKKKLTKQIKNLLLLEIIIKLLKSILPYVIRMMDKYVLSGG